MIGRIARVILLVSVLPGSQYGYGQDEPSADVPKDGGWKRERLLTGHGAYVTDVSFSPDGSHLISCSWDGTVRVWSTSTWKQTRKLDLGAVTSEENVQVRKVWLNPKGDTLTILHGDKLSAWAFDDFRKPITVRTIGLCRSVVASRDRGRFYILKYDDVIEVLDGKGFAVVERLAGKAIKYSTLALSPDGKVLATGGNDELRRVGLRRSRDLESLRTLEGLEGEVISQCFSADGLFFAAQNRTRAAASAAINPVRIRVWNTRDWVEIASFAGDEAGDLMFTKDGKGLLAATARNEIFGWDLKEAAVAFKLVDGHRGKVPDGQHNTTYLTSIDVAPDGSTMATGSYDTTIQIWKRGR